MSRNLFMLSGLLCDETVWNKFSANFGEEVQVHVRDFRGFDDLSRMADSVLETAPETFSLVGHSMGARVALEIYKKAPDRVERLALLDTGVHPAKPNEAAGRQKLVDLAYEQGMAELAREWLPPMVHPKFADNQQKMEPLVAMVKRMTPEIYSQQVKALLNRPDADAVLSSITCPTLVGVGQEDRWSPLEQHQYIASKIPFSQLVVFENSGHMAPFENPEQVEQALRAWLWA